MAMPVDHENTPIDLRAIGARVWQKRYRIIIITLISCIVAYILVSFIPRTYESSASILVESRENTFSRATNDTGAGGVVASDAVVMSSQVQLVQSSENYLRVIRNLNLAEVAEFNGTAGSPLDAILGLMGRSADRTQASEQKVLALLSKAITVVQQRDSRVISVLVRAQDKNLAADIANAIAQEHVKRRAELSNDDTAGASLWLQSEIEKLRVNVVDAESAVAKFRIENDLFTGANNTSLLNQQLSNIAAQISTAQERKLTARSRATLIRDLLNSGQAIDGVAEVQNSVVIQRLSQDKARLQGEKAQLSATLLPNHPQVRSITAQIEEINTQILREGRRVADAIMAESRIEDALVASLQEDMARLKISASSAATSSVELQELEREAGAQSALLQTYLLRFREASARAGAGAVLPDVRVIAVAMPALKPVAPKGALILVAVAIVAVSMQIGGILFAELSVVMPLPALSAAKGDQQQDQENDDNPDVADEEEFSSQPPEPILKNRSIRSDEVSPVPDEGPSVVPDIAPASAPQTAGQRASAPNVYQGRNAAAENEHVPPPSRNTFAREHAPHRTEQPQPKEQPPVSSGVDTDFYDLAEALCTGHEQIVFLSAFDPEGDCTGVGEMLISEILANGRSVAIVDAGSGVISSQPGISDLAANEAEFGEVVFHSEDDGLTEIYWGTRRNIYSASEKPATLVEALCDICDVVLVFVGGVGATSNLPLFAGLDGTLTMVAGAQPEYSSSQRALDEAQALGFARSQLLVMPKNHANAA